MEQYKQKIYQYIERAFETAPDTQLAEDAKEELYANLIDKFEELTAEGQPPEDAYYAVIGSIGDIYEMLDSLKEEDEPKPVPERVQRDSFWAGIGTAIPYCAGFAVVLLVCMLFYKPMLAPIWKAVICIVSALVLISTVGFGRFGKKKKQLPALVITIGLLVVTVVSMVLSLNPRFEGVIWLISLMVLAGYEAICTMIPVFKKKKEENHEE